MNAESADRGDILLRLNLTGEIRGLGRKIPYYGHDATGSVEFSVEVNATQRLILPYVDVGFKPGTGKRGLLDGWLLRERSQGAANPFGVDLWVIAGPQHNQDGGFGGAFKALGACVFNPFACSDITARVDWSVQFDQSGNLTQASRITQEGHGPGGLLVLEGVSLTVTRLIS